MMEDQNQKDRPHNKYDLQEIVFGPRGWSSSPTIRDESDVHASPTGQLVEE